MSAPKAAYCLTYQATFCVSGGEVVIAALEADERQLVKQFRITPQFWDLEESCDMLGSGWVRYTSEEPMEKKDLEAMAIFIGSLDKAVAIMKDPKK